jgi:hypothetical protein
MFDPHQLIARYGLAGARTRTSNKIERLCVDAAAAMADRAGEKRDPIFAGPAAASIPLRRVAGPPDPTEPWVRELHSVRYRFETGPGGTGLPFGSKARLILIWLHDQAVKRNSPVLDTAPSIHTWAKNLGMESGGMTYRIGREQFSRVATCRVAFAMGDDPLPETSVPIIDPAIFNNITGKSGSVAEFFAETWDNTGPVTLSDGFFRHVTEDPIALDPFALSLVGNNCWALDLYIVSAFRLPRLADTMFLSWREFYAAFAGHNKHAHHMKASFLAAAPLVQAIYKQARIRVEPEGITFYPSPPPMS